MGIRENPAAAEYVSSLHAQRAPVVVIEDGTDENYWGQARARRSGHRLEADLEVAVEKSLSVQAGHEIAHTVEEHLRQHVPHLQQATIHVIPTQTEGARGS